MKTVRNSLLIGFLVLMMTAFTSQEVKAHCEIPCGIYQDTLRIELISEHITTIEKSMKEIEKLSKDETINYNQLVRWINNKEEHANKIQEIATQYFMFQRVKLSDDKDVQLKNITLLSLLHEITVYAMKCKQSTDVEQTQNLSDSLEEFAKLYFVPNKHHHH